MTSHAHVRTRNHRRLLVLIPLAIALLAGGMATARAAGPEYLVCRFTGTSTISPGVTLTVENHEFTSDVTFSDCHSSDPALTSGTATTTGTFTGSCAAGTGAAEQRVRWNTGRHSEFVATFTNALALEYVDGTVRRGEFAGLQLANGNVESGSPQDGAQCFGSGLTHGSFSGVVVLGRPPVDVLRLVQS